CFAIIWNSFIGFFFAVLLLAGAKGNGPPWQMMAFLSVFLAVGIGLAYFAIKMKFERTLLFIERDRAALRKTLFGRTKTQEVELEKGSVAALALSYEQNDQPVYAVTLNGVGKVLRFGTALSDPEKEWVVDRVNEVIGARDPLQATPTLRFPERCA